LITVLCELRLSWPWLLPVLLGQEPTTSWPDKSLLKGGRRDVAAIVHNLMCGSPARKKGKLIDNVIECIKDETVDKALRTLRPDLPCVQEALEVVDLCAPFVDKVYIDPLHEGLDEEFEGFFFICRILSDGAIPGGVAKKHGAAVCKGGCISNETHIGTAVQFSLGKLDCSDTEPTPRVFLCFHPCTPSSKRGSRNTLLQVAALFWRQAMQCEIIDCTTEQEIRMQLKAKLMKNDGNAPSSSWKSSPTNTKRMHLDCIPILVLVKDCEDGPPRYVHRNVNYKMDLQKPTLVTTERESIYDTKESLVKAVASVTVRNRKRG